MEVKAVKIKGAQIAFRSSQFVACPAGSCVLCGSPILSRAQMNCCDNQITLKNNNNNNNAVLLCTGQSANQFCKYFHIWRLLLRMLIGKDESELRVLGKRDYLSGLLVSFFSIIVQRFNNQKKKNLINFCEIIDFCLT